MLVSGRHALRTAVYSIYYLHMPPAASSPTRASSPRIQAKAKAKDGAAGKPAKAPKAKASAGSTPKKKTVLPDI